jgi:hypothetical protein
LNESNDDCSNQGKEAGVAQDNIREDDNAAGDDKEANDNEALESE